MDLSYLFTIFFLTLGPLKVIPSFYLVTLGMDTKIRRKLAIKGGMYALIIVMIIALVSNFIANAWRISLPSFTLAGGIILFITSFKIVSKFSFQNPKIPSEQTKEVGADIIKFQALSPIAIPGIISPIGIVAVMSSMLFSKGDIEMQVSIFGLLLLMMVLNFMGMWNVRTIVKMIGMPVYSVIGWVFSVIQAGLAIQIIMNSIHKLFP